MSNNDPRVTWLVRGVRALSLGLSARQPVLSHGPHTASALNPKAHYLPPLHVPRAPASGTAPLPPGSGACHRSTFPRDPISRPHSP